MERGRILPEMGGEASGYLLVALTFVSKMIFITHVLYFIVFWISVFLRPACLACFLACLIR